MDWEEHETHYDTYYDTHSSTASNAPQLVYQAPTFQPTFPTYTTHETIPTNTRGRSRPRGHQTQQGYQPGTLTRGYFANTIKSVQRTRGGPRRGNAPPVVSHNDRREAPQTQDSRTLMDQVRDIGVVTNLRDTEIRHEAREVIDELLFKH